MLSRIVVVLALVGCGGSKPAPAAPPAPEPAPVAVAQPAPVAPPEPAPPVEAVPPSAQPQKPLLERLRDAEGKVPGLAGFSIKRKSDANYCGGVQIVTTRAKKVAKDDAPLVAVYKLEFPKGLSFDPDPKQLKKKEASKVKFDKFLEELSKVGGDARKHYEQKLTDGDATAKVAAAARLAQVYLRLASVLVRAEVPIDVRTGEFAEDKIRAFCDALAEKAEAIQALGEQAMTFCAEKAKAVDAGWWNEVCVAP
jgi:hypothetical protein